MSQIHTIKDIAKALNVSVSTVSRAVRDTHDVSIATKQKIMAYAKSINYKPNRIAQILKAKKSFSIGVVIGNISNPFFSQVIDGIEHIAAEKGYQLVFVQSNETYESEVKALSFLHSQFVDGVIMSLSNQTKNTEHIQALIDDGIPVVLFDKVEEKIDTHKIRVDNKKGTFDATTHLLQSGFKNIAAIAGNSFFDITKERVSGYKQALEEANMVVNTNCIKYCEYGGLNYAEVETCVQELLTMNIKPDAIITCNDTLTYTVFKLLQDYKIAIPKKMGLIGFSNSHFADVVTPKLSTIKQPAENVGAAACNLLLDLLNAKEPTKNFITKVLLPKLCIRESSIKK